jgi:hypothetical protein
MVVRMSNDLQADQQKPADPVSEVLTRRVFESLTAAG